MKHRPAHRHISTITDHVTPQSPQQRQIDSQHSLPAAARHGYLTTESDSPIPPFNQP
ncbi:hypothetical protein [Xylella fastidiosa]|uniref:Uncharacterized protein n=1 Tax=Xylella fastidiosa subsp. multiplex TaxID=644357 RepID=A0AAW6HSQ8_XYLFS|nr:hypothetical protein [Xylella fastidiosa]MDC6407227.1 hypothetical protein [Xylella fastidiosa subsp. multiplex]